MSKYFQNADAEYDFSNTDEALIQNFKIDHPDAVTITTKEQILTLVNLSDDFRSWYLEWKELRSSYDERPLFIGDSPEDLRLWRELTENRQELKKANKRWQDEINLESRKLRETVERVSKQREDYYSKLNPVVIISQINVNNLPREELLLVALEGDLDKRELLVEKFVLRMQKDLFKQYKDTGKVKFPWLEKEV